MQYCALVRRAAVRTTERSRTLVLLSGLNGRWALLIRTSESKDRLPNGEGEMVRHQPQRLAAMIQQMRQTHVQHTDVQSALNMEVISKHCDCELKSAVMYPNDANVRHVITRETEDRCTQRSSECRREMVATLDVIKATAGSQLQCRAQARGRRPRRKSKGLTAQRTAMHHSAG